MPTICQALCWLCWQPWEPKGKVGFPNISSGGRFCCTLFKASWNPIVLKLRRVSNEKKLPLEWAPWLTSFPGCRSNPSKINYTEFKKHLLCTYNMSGTIPGSRETGINATWIQHVGWSCCLKCVQVNSKESFICKQTSEEAGLVGGMTDWESRSLTLLLRGYSTGQGKLGTWHLLLL